MRIPLFTNLLLITLVSISLQAVAQTPPDLAPRQMTDRELGEFYLAKSKKQKTIGFVMLGGGIAFQLIGAAIASQDVYSENTGAAILVTTGFFSMIGSIPLFISSARNKGRAEILLRNENIPLGHIPNAPRIIPAVGLKYKIGR
jgi:hypothetical protein